MVSYSIEQLAEQIVGPGFYLTNKGSTRAVEICEDFNESINAKAIMIRIAREMGMYGNSPLERRFTSIEKAADEFKATKLGDLVSVQPLPISTMRIVPSMFTGADPPKGYTQIIMGQWRRFAPEQMAWFKWNATGGQIGSDFYGQGLISPILDYVWGIQQMEDFMVRIMKRYAAPKILWRIGSEKFPPRPDDITAWATKLQTVRPDEDWVAPFTNDAKTLEANLQARFAEYVNHFQSQIIAGLQNPNLILSLLVLRVSDASAKAMQDAWNRKIENAQEVIKELWEDLILKPLVVQEGLDEDVTPELAWGQPTIISSTPETQIQQLTFLLDPKSVAITPYSRFDFENMLRSALGLEQLPKELRPVQAAQAAAALGTEGGEEESHSTETTQAENGNGNGNGNGKVLAEAIKKIERNGRKKR
jgi:hypothetical protein